jgi:hypothetical protein
MAENPDPILERIRAFDRSKGGGVEAVRSRKGYSLFAATTGAPIARLRPTGSNDKVEVLWWRRECWAPFGPFGKTVMPLDEALELIASEPAFWISIR